MSAAEAYVPSVDEDDGQTVYPYMVTGPTFPGYGKILNQCRRAWESWTTRYPRPAMSYNGESRAVDYDHIRDDPTLKEFVAVGRWRVNDDGVHYFQHSASAGVRLRKSDGQLQVVGLTMRTPADGRRLLRHLKPACESLRGVTSCKLYIEVWPDQKALADIVTDHGFDRQKEPDDVPFPRLFGVDYVYPLGSSRLADALYREPKKTGRKRA